MRRLLAACLAIALVWTLVRPATAHVHVSGALDRVVHDHGPAAGHHHHHDDDEHHAARKPTTGDAVAATQRLNGRDAGHAVFFKVSTTTATTAFMMPFEVVEVYVLPVDPPRGGAIVLLEPRQHGPPAFAPVPARAPPASLIA